MQVITPQQAQALSAFSWQALDKLIWIALGWGGLQIHRKLKHILAVLNSAAQLPAQLAAHTEEDKKQFAAQSNLIQIEAEATRREFKLALQEHVQNMHQKPHAAR